MRTPQCEIIHGDSALVLPTMQADSVDAIAVDPPAGISFMGKGWDHHKGGRREWVAWLASVMGQGLRVLKPGGYAFVWALPRTSHWTATALEDAGFEIRDVVVHVFGSGFPKSKALLKPASEHWILCRKPGPLRHLRIDECRVGFAGADDAAESKGKNRHADFGSGPMQNQVYGEFKRDRDNWSPSGRWPANFVLSHCGPDDEGNPGCERVGTRAVPSNGHHPGRRGSAGVWSGEGGGLDGTEGGERYMGPDGTEDVPAYRCAEGCPVALLDRQSGIRKSGNLLPHHKRGENVHAYGKSNGAHPWHAFGGDTGTASRFFHCFDPEPFVYQAKASRKDRGEGNRHPTVKSTALMRHLVRLIAAPGDLVLDMFTGSGSTGVACLAEGMRFIGIEQDAESVEIARARLALATDRRCAAAGSVQSELAL